MWRILLLILVLLFASYAQYKAKTSLERMKIKKDQVETFGKELGYIVVEKLTRMSAESKMVNDHTMSILLAGQGQYTTCDKLVCLAS